MISSCLSGTAVAFRSLWPLVMNAGVDSRPGAESTIAATSPNAAEEGVVGVAAWVDVSTANATWLREERVACSTLEDRLTGCLAAGTASRSGDVSKFSVASGLLLPSLRRVR
jgi:hypothetical protein